jgi:hypothetical protein
MTLALDNEKAVLKSRNDGDCFSNILWYFRREDAGWREVGFL